MLFFGIYCFLESVFGNMMLLISVVFKIGSFFGICCLWKYYVIEICCFLWCCFWNLLCFEICCFLKFVVFWYLLILEIWCCWNLLFFNCCFLNLLFYEICCFLNLLFEICCFLNLLFIQSVVYLICCFLLIAKIPQNIFV